MKHLNFSMRFILTTLSWMILCTPLTQAQLKNWTLPGHYVDVSTIFIPSLLPTLPGPGHYNGASTPLSHNLVHDENGNLLFFVIGTEIYDHTGHFAGSITQSYYDVVPATGNPIPGGNNSTEMAIIPVPCDNDRYFVVFGHGEASPNRARIRYGMVDLTWNILDGLLVQPHTDSNGDPQPGVRGVLDVQADHRPQINFAVSSGVNNEHHLYIQVGGDIRAFKTGTDQDGVPNISPLSLGKTATLSNTAPDDNSAGSISGTELELSHDNTKLVAVSSLRNGSSSNGTTHYEVFDLDPITGSFLGTSNVYSFTNVGLGKGMAFSPNGQYLWVTLAADPDFMGGASTLPTIGVNYFPLTAGSSPTLTPMISNEDFSLSQLEIGANGILIALGDNASGTAPQIAIVNDPDNPTITSSGFMPATGMSFPLSDQLGTGLLHHGIRLIPDQIETHTYGAPALSILGESYEFDCNQDAAICPTILSGSAPYNFTVSYQGTIVSSGSNVGSICFPAGEECGEYILKASDGNGCSIEVPFQINRTATAGTLSGPTHISPPDPFYLSLSGYTGEYVEYQLLTNCSGSNPNGWVTIATGKLPQYDNVFNTTHNWKNCFLTDELTYCFRAKVYCKEPKDEDSYNCLPTITDELCIPVCVEGICEPGGENGSLGKLGSGKNPSVELFPNPAQNKININLEKVEQNTDVTIRIMDIQGKIQTEIKGSTSSEGIFLQKLDISNLPSGIYLMNVLTENFITTEKFVKE